jgi:hypothetical protein
MATMPGLEQRIRDGLERGLDDLVTELAKPDDEWDAAAWQPPGLPAACSRPLGCCPALAEHASRLHSGGWTCT